jgi:hypothetical protein
MPNCVRATDVTRRESHVGQAIEEEQDSHAGLGSRDAAGGG